MQGAVFKARRLILRWSV